MSKAIVLDSKFKKSGDLALPKEYKEINSHNLYLSVKSYLASVRSNTAKSKTRSEVSGGGKKPWGQKGQGRARAGSMRSPLFRTGGVIHGPRGNRNYDQKINKKQKRLALKYAIFEKANSNKLFVIDKLEVKSGKTKDAAKINALIDKRSVLYVCKLDSENTYLAFRNIENSYVMDYTEVNAYFVAAFDSVVFEKEVIEHIINENGDNK